MKPAVTLAEMAAPPRALPARLLIADDQAHILEALQLLLKPEGYLLHAVRSPAEALTELACDSFDAVLIDLNYSRDTTSGAEGLELIRQIPRDRQSAASDRDDSVGQHRSGGRSDPSGGARFYSEAVGERPAADHCPHPD